MLFNSLEFLIFFPIVCLIYFLLKNIQHRNLFLLLASYYFYMNWEPIYALLILTSTILTFACGLLVEKNKDKKKAKKTFLVISLIINFTILFLFKYYNFINESVYTLLEYFGIRWNVPNMSLLLPVGISFYTFQAVGYSIDVYRGSVKAEHNFITYALFVSFFPQLVAGPIERSANLLPQFKIKHVFNYERAIEGFKLMLWGFFMKLCVADVLSEYVNAVYNNIPNHNGTSLIIASIFFAFQIYCDFAGYSNIAIGTAKIMGFDLMKNFNLPYFSLNIKEFWRRWHISLSSWFTDYLYIPLGGNRVKYARHLTNLMITFLVSGIWHGANWTFVLWGMLHGVYLILDNIIRKYLYSPKYNTLISKLFSIFICFILVDFAWIFFRTNNVADAFSIICKIFTDIGAPFVDLSIFTYGLLSLFILILKDTKDAFNLRLNFMHSKYTIVRFLSFILLTIYVLLCGSFSSGQFIYFQF